MVCIGFGWPNPTLKPVSSPKDTNVSARSLPTKIPTPILEPDRTRVVEESPQKSPQSRLLVCLLDLWAMGSAWGWVAGHWGTATISGVFGFAGGLLASILRWRWPSWKEWDAERREKRHSEIDERVLEAVRYPDQGRKRQMTGRGHLVIRTDEVVQSLSLDHTTVADSLERLEAKGRVQRISPSMSDRYPGWFAVSR